MYCKRLEEQPLRLISMDHREEPDFLLSGQTVGADESDEEIEVTAAEVLVQLENVRSISVIVYPFLSIRLTDSLF